MRSFSITSRTTCSLNSSEYLAAGMVSILSTQGKKNSPSPRNTTHPRSRPWTRPPGTGVQLAAYAGLALVTRRSGSSIRGEHVSHGDNNKAQVRPIPVRFRPHYAPPSLLGLTISANAPKANRLGPGRPRPGPLPHLDPACHDPQRHPLQPTDINTATRSRLTHHIGSQV